ncbi:MAG: DUF4162 domain-containing protein [Calditrichaeota bacterium]|nr:DUF4162 domain-containing protein [Calditrichota bacterium]
MRVREILRFYASLKNGRNIKKEVDHWLEILGLSDWANKKVSTLSKGMSQKVQFISAVVSKPKLLILDEPFTGLDPVNTDVIVAEILKLQSQGMTIIFSTHDMEIAEKMCDFIFMIFKGKKVLDGTLTSIQDDYGSDTLRVSCENGVSALENLDGVDKINDFGQIQELHMTEDCNTQDLLSKIISRTNIKSFEITKPSLHDIFVRIANPEQEDSEDA